MSVVLRIENGNGVAFGRLKSGPSPQFSGPAPSASTQPEAATMVAMFHAHPFNMNNAATFEAAADVRACTNKTTTTKD